MVFVEGEKHQNLENNLCSKEESNNIISPHITNTGFEPELQCKWGAIVHTTAQSAVLLKSTVIRLAVFPENYSNAIAKQVESETARMTSPLEVLVTKNFVTGCRKSRQVPLLFETLRDALQDGEKLSLIIFHALQLHVFSLSLAPTLRPGSRSKWPDAGCKPISEVSQACCIALPEIKGGFWHQSKT